MPSVLVLASRSLSIYLLAPGVYPIKLDKQDWYVNDDRQNRVTRRQFPICPHFANTVYTAQGLTIHKGLLDLKVSAQTDATTLYVGMSRFRRADDLLILQPFDLDVLQQGAPAAPTFLLDHLQNTVDGRHDEAAEKAEAYRERVRDERRKKRTADRRRAENLSEEDREAKRQALAKGDEGLSPESREKRQASNQRNKGKGETAVCDVCGSAKTRSEYVRNQWQHRKQTVPTCRECQLNAKGTVR